ncbi:YdcF family protein [Rossellomorea aquimaris]|uniref:YdcF family protein n=1 Tax=Rossellomorea aquimaris TaxID=189382 RepID=UPI0007D066AE|nr:YdcF family protein [Rossellomorea aquimaris]
MKVKPILSKEPHFPEMDTHQISWLTQLTFGNKTTPSPCDAIFIFSGTHPGHWEKAIEAFQLNLSSTFIVTGGRSLTGAAHLNWKGNADKTLSEASVIISYLRNAGVPQEQIVFEESSTNSLENVLCAKEVFDFTKVSSLLVICKSHVAGRQIRTLKKHLPTNIDFVPYTFNTIYHDKEISRENWMLHDIGKKRVWGEYLRISYYGELGHLEPIKEG